MDGSTMDPDGRGGMSASLRWPLPIEAVYLLAPVFVVALAALLNPIAPYDYFWALVQGRTIVQSGGNPTQNLFLYTLPPEAPYFNQPWLAQLILYGVATTVGHGGNIVLLAAMLGISMALVVDAGLRLGLSARRVAVVALVAAPFLAVGAGVRTQMFAFPCFAAAAWVVFVPGWGWRRVGILALITAIHANVHGSFVLLPVLAAVGMSEKQGGPWGPRIGGVAASVLASCAHPGGVGNVGYVLGLSRAMGVAGRTSIEEWRHLSPVTALGAGFTAAVVGFLVVAARGRWRERVGSIGIFVAVAAAAYVTRRLLPFAALLVPVVLPRPKNGGVRREPPTVAQGYVHLAFLCVFLTGPALCLPGAPLSRLVDRFRAPRDRSFSSEIPLGLAAMAATWPTVRVFHTQAVGGLLEWNLGIRRPRPVAFVDQRFEIIPARIWSDYTDVCLAREGYRRIIDAHGIGAALVDDREAGPLVRALAADPAWRFVDGEGPFHLYVRRVGTREK